MSEILNIAHEFAKGLMKVGAMDIVTMREIETLCLPPARGFQPEDIKRIRKRNRASQAVFAVYLNVGKTTVQQWEHGKKKPSGPALRLLDVVDRKGLDALS